jgi:alkylhydroperoxidase family enzyme
VEALKKKTWRELETLSERDRALLTVAEKVSAQPTRMTDEDWEPLRRLGFDDTALLEVTHVVGIFNYLTRLADGMGLLLDAETDQASRTGVGLERQQTAAADPGR